MAQYAANLCQLAAMCPDLLLKLCDAVTHGRQATREPSHRACGTGGGGPHPRRRLDARPQVIDVHGPPHVGMIATASSRSSTTAVAG